MQLSHPQPPILNAFLEVGGQDCSRNEGNMLSGVGNIILNAFLQGEEGETASKMKKMLSEAGNIILNDFFLGGRGIEANIPSGVGNII